VIDVEGADPVVILGSCTWTDSGVYDNDENTLIIHAVCRPGATTAADHW
jgi:hypothetical protein